MWSFGNKFLIELLWSLPAAAARWSNKNEGKPLGRLYPFIIIASIVSLIWKKIESG